MRILQRLCQAARVLNLVFGYLLWTALCHASTISLGVLSFNTLIPGAPGSPGVNGFSLDNFTGTSSIPPDFPAADSLSFLNGSLKLTLQDGSQQTVTLGDLGPGSYTPASLQYSATTAFTSVMFTATLDRVVFSLSDGSRIHADSAQISISLTSSSGPVLVPDVDFAAIDVSASPTAVPEPSSVSLLLSGLAAALWLRRVKRLLR